MSGPWAKVAQSVVEERQDPSEKSPCFLVGQCFPGLRLSRQSHAPSCLIVAAANIALPKNQNVRSCHLVRCPGNAAALLRGLLNPYHGHVRLAAQFVLQRITAAEPRCRMWLLRLLGTAQALIMGCNPEVRSD